MLRHVKRVLRGLVNRIDRRPDYRSTWLGADGEAYRKAVYERQKQGGSRPLDANPTVDEVRGLLRLHRAKTVLEVGCGWGRLVGSLGEEFGVTGCDVSEEMLALCPEGVEVFQFDLAADQWNYHSKASRRWDVVLCRGVMLYLVDEPLYVAYAMNNMLMFAREKILVFEWPEVCDVMRQISASPVFEYHPIQHREE